MHRILNNIDLHIYLGSFTTIGATLTALAIAYLPILQALSFIVSICAGGLTLALAFYKWYKKIKQNGVTRIKIPKKE
jgi:hypothetical protein